MVKAIAQGVMGTKGHIPNYQRQERLRPGEDARKSDNHVSLTR